MVMYDGCTCTMMRLHSKKEEKISIKVLSAFFVPDTGLCLQWSSSGTKDAG